MVDISYFKNATSTEPSTVNAVKVLQAIQEGKFKSVVEILRAMPEEEYKEKKKLLPAVTFSGTFSERKASCLLEYSGLVVLDIDNLEEGQINTLFNFVTDEPGKDNHVLAFFNSPSNKGVKVIYKVNTGPENHLAAFLHLQKMFQDKYLVKVDDSGKDVSRLCFVSYDPHCFINENATPFEVDLAYGEVKTYTPNEKLLNYQPEKDYSKIFDLCRKWVEGPPTSIEYVSGQRNRYVHALSCALNRTGVPMRESVEMLYKTFTDLEQKEIYHCCQSAYFKNANEHGSVSVKDISVTEYKAPAYVMNYTDNVVENDLMTITSMLYQHKVHKDEIARIVSKVARYYEIKGFIDIDRATLSGLMNKALEMLNNKVLVESSEKSLKYETAAEIGTRLVAQDFTEGIIQTFLGGLDEDMGGGLMPKSFYGIIGVGGTFKSVLLQYICYANAANGIPALYCNFEMADFQFYERLASMVLAINLRYMLVSKKITQENISEYIDLMNTQINNNLFVTSSRGANEETINATLAMIKASTGKTIRLIGVDGISQLDDKGKEEIPAAIMNTGVCKEIAKSCNDGEGAVVLGLMHVSGDSNKLLRDTGSKCRGGIKTVANMDGYFSTSLLLDPETNNLDNTDDLMFLSSKFYLRLVDKRTRTGVVNKIINVNDTTLHLSIEDCDPHTYEIKRK